MMLPNLEALRSAADVIHRVMPPTPQISWPLLCERAETEVWVKHENHTALGAFKVRGGILYLQELIRAQPKVSAVITATRGNHGQSIAFAARRAGIRALVVVPHGNSVEKNAAMRALGATLIEHGEDFQEAYEHAATLVEAQGLHFVRSFNETIVRGVASYALELFDAVRELDAVYVPIGQGSGICGAIAARNALGLKTEIIGVVAEGAPAYALSAAAGRPVSSGAVATIADGMACRVPDPTALKIILAGTSRLVVVADAQIRAAMRHLFTDTHNATEGAGAAALAALLKENARMKGRRVAIVQSGGNVDHDLFAQVLGESA